jgi:prevent-host-death family protein
MFITATDFKNNLGKYLALAATEDIIITKNGKSVAKLSNTKQDKTRIVKSLFGIIPDDGSTIKQIREERLSRYETAD